MKNIRYKNYQDYIKNKILRNISNKEKLDLKTMVDKYEEIYKFFKIMKKMINIKNAVLSKDF